MIHEFSEERVRELFADHFEVCYARTVQKHGDHYGDNAREASTLAELIESDPIAADQLFLDWIDAQCKDDHLWGEAYDFCLTDD